MISWSKIISAESFCQTKTSTWTEMITKSRFYSLAKIREEKGRTAAAPAEVLGCRKKKKISFGWNERDVAWWKKGGGRIKGLFLQRAGGSWPAENGDRAERLAKPTKNVGLSLWVIRLYESSPWHTSGPLLSLTLRVPGNSFFCLLVHGRSEPKEPLLLGREMSCHVQRWLCRWS